MIHFLTPPQADFGRWMMSYQLTPHAKKSKRNFFQQLSYFRFRTFRSVSSSLDTRNFFEKKINSSSTFSGSNSKNKSSLSIILFTHLSDIPDTSHETDFVLDFMTPTTDKKGKKISYFYIVIFLSQNVIVQ